jgi:arsenate reductase
LNKVYYLKTCDTCRRIMKGLDLSGFKQQNIKTEGISENQIDEMAALSGSYESLFSRRAQNYKKLGLKDKNLSENDIRKLILKDYTFLKRPVFIVGSEIFIGSDKKNIERLYEVLKADKSA